MLLLINGAPGVGKSTLARLHADEHPLALIVEIDSIRTQLGQWRERDDSKIVARDLAVVLIRAHLLAGHDVIVPQFLARSEFRERLAHLARDADVRFVEVVLTADDEVLMERFRGRRGWYRETGAQHPEADLIDGTIATDLSVANARVVEDAKARGVPVISIAVDAQAAYRELEEALAELA